MTVSSFSILNDYCYDLSLRNLDIALHAATIHSIDACSLLSCISGATVRLVGPSDPVSEDVGSRAVCAELLEGELATDVTVLLNTNDQTANSKAQIALY